MVAGRCAVGFCSGATGAGRAAANIGIGGVEGIVAVVEVGSCVCCARTTARLTHGAAYTALWRS